MIPISNPVNIDKTFRYGHGERLYYPTGDPLELLAEAVFGLRINGKIPYHTADKKIGKGLPPKSHNDHPGNPETDHFSHVPLNGHHTWNTEFGNSTIDTENVPKNKDTILETCKKSIDS